MRLACLALALLLAGCLESGDGPAVGDPTPPPPASTPPATPTLTATPTPSATPSPTPGVTPTPSPAPGGDVPFRTLAHGPQSDIGSPEREAIHDQQRYDAFWARVRGDPSEPAPAVDFGSETVVAVAAGQRGNTCWAIRVTGASDGENGTQVVVTTYSPPPDAFCGQAITYPWHLVALQGARREVRFVEMAQAGPSEQ